MMLKNVVLPAPLGPMRLTIEPSGMSKSTLRTATRPPKRLVIALARSTTWLASAAARGALAWPGRPSALGRVG